MHSLSSAPPVYIHKAHQNTIGSAVSELMRFIIFHVRAHENSSFIVLGVLHLNCVASLGESLDFM